MGFGPVFYLFFFFLGGGGSGEPYTQSPNYMLERVLLTEGKTSTSKPGRPSMLGGVHGFSKIPYPDPREDPKSRSLKRVPIRYPLVVRVPN